MKPKNLNLRSSRMINRSAEVGLQQPVQTMSLRATSPKLFYISPIPDSVVDSRNEKISFSDDRRFIDIRVTYNSNNIRNVTKLSLLKLLGINSTPDPESYSYDDTFNDIINAVQSDDPDLIYNEYEFTINYYDSYSAADQTFYRFSFANDEEKNRYMKLFDNDGWATIIEDNQNGSYPEKRKGNSEYLFMYNVTMPTSTGTIKYNRYAIKVKDVEIIEK
jgi:hypothetical protein